MADVTYNEEMVTSARSQKFLHTWLSELENEIIKC